MALPQYPYSSTSPALPYTPTLLEALSLDPLLDTAEEPLPTYNTLSTLSTSLSTGPPTAIIAVPMLSSTRKPSFKTLFTGRSPPIRISVHARRMTRGHYLKHYAHDAWGNFVGTEKPAPDACLVLIPGKSEKEDIERQFGRLRVEREGALARAAMARGSF